MLLLPRFFKYKKKQKGKVFNRIDNIIEFKSIHFNSIKLIALSHGRITAKQINSIYLTLNKSLKKIGIVKLNLFPQNPISKKPVEVRMGKGKGNVDHWVFNVKVGFIICEIQTTFKNKVYSALKMAQIRLPIKTKILFF
jgi:large subunit ribosomal protein L16